MTSGQEVDVSSKLKLPYVVSETVVAITAIIGNTLVIVAFKRDKKLRRRRSNYYIISLAVADLSVGLIGIPCAVLSSLGLPRHFELCLFTVSLLVIFCTISIFSLVAVSIDRYWAILHPMSYSARINTKITLGIIYACWILGMIIGLLPLLGWHAKRTAECIFTKVMDYNYLVFLFFGTIVFPAILLIIFYLHIYDVILKQVRQMISLNESVNLNGCDNNGVELSVNVFRETRRKEVKATQNLSIIVLFFVVCWMPLYMINCVQAFWSDFDVPDVIMDLCIILSHLNSAGNPLLYAYHLSDFRWALKSLLLTTTATVESSNFSSAHNNNSSSNNNNNNNNNNNSKRMSDVRIAEADKQKEETSTIEGKARQTLMLVKSKNESSNNISFGRKSNNKLFAFGTKIADNDNDFDKDSEYSALSRFRYIDPTVANDSGNDDTTSSVSSYTHRFYRNGYYVSWSPDYRRKRIERLNCSDFYYDRNRNKKSIINSRQADDNIRRCEKTDEFNSNVSYGYLSIDDTNYYESISSNFNDTRISNGRHNNNNNNPKVKFTREEFF